jgi:hypothetical protein
MWLCVWRFCLFRLLDKLHFQTLLCYLVFTRHLTDYSLDKVLIECYWRKPIKFSTTVFSPISLRWTKSFKSWLDILEWFHCLVECFKMFNTFVVIVHAGTNDVNKCNKPSQMILFKTKQDCSCVFASIARLRQIIRLDSEIYSAILRHLPILHEHYWKLQLKKRIIESPINKTGIKSFGQLKLPIFTLCWRENKGYDRYTDFLLCFCDV